jgi:hypothetical protein
MDRRGKAADTAQASPPWGRHMPDGATSWDFAACAIVLLFVLTLGLTPHLRLIADVGQVAFFQMGFDEDAYIVFMVSKYFEIGRALSHYALSFLFALTGHSVDWTMILADVIFPGATAIAAYYLASQVIYSWQGRAFLALALIFGQDLLSLANVAVWAERPWLSDFRKLFGELGRSLVPDSTTSYLTILRTPEPQLSYAVVFVLLGLLLKIGRSEGVPTTASFVATACLSLLLPVTYTYVAFPTLLVAVWIALVTLVYGRHDVALRLLAIVVAACVAFAWITIAVGGGSSIFSSRLPSVTPSLLLCALLVVPLAIWTLLRRPADRTAWLAVGFLLTPVVVSNQQIITGVTISARDWERNINYQFLVLGAALISTRLAVRSPRLIRSFRWGAACMALAIAVVIVIVRANNTAFRYWLPSNTPATIATIRRLRPRERTIRM